MKYENIQTLKNYALLERLERFDDWSGRDAWA